MNEASLKNAHTSGKVREASITHSWKEFVLSGGFLPKVRLRLPTLTAWVLWLVGDDECDFMAGRLSLGDVTIWPQWGGWVPAQGIGILGNSRTGILRSGGEIQKKRHWRQSHIFAHPPRLTVQKYEKKLTFLLVLALPDFLHPGLTWQVELHSLNELLWLLMNKPWEPSPSVTCFCVKICPNVQETCLQINFRM